MGANSTMEITRQDAIGLIVQALPNASDDRLASILYDLVGRESLTNFDIVGNYHGGWSLKYSTDADRVRPLRSDRNDEEDSGRD